MAYKDSEKRKVYHRAYYLSHRVLRPRVLLDPEEKKRRRVVRQARLDADPVRQAWKQEYNRLISRFKRFGLTHEDFGYMMERCGGTCPGCECEMQTYGKGNPSTAHIDHNHETNEIRGLLCQQCNMILGYAKDNPAVLRNLVGYVEVS